jgi:hypothetical protein
MEYRVSCHYGDAVLTGAVYSYQMHQHISASYEYHCIWVTAVSTIKYGTKSFYSSSICGYNTLTQLAAYRLKRKIL